MGKRSRKRRPAIATATTSTPPPVAPDPAAAPEPVEEPAPSKSELRNREIRAGLVPLQEGERPGAVTVAAVVALLIGVGNLIALVVGVKVQGKSAGAGGVILLSSIFLLMAWGLWRVKYWAVLGMQALLGITLVFAFLSLLLTGAWETVPISLATIGLAGWLFWKLIRAMARIQMPTYER